MTLTSRQNEWISKFLSFVLRHRPAAAGVTLDSGGWALVEDLVCNINNLETFENLDFTIEVLEEVVERDSKTRFSFNADKTKIRANQGHSVAVDLELEIQTPPDVLYHGTPVKNRNSILSTGLKPGQRHAVHLSADVETAQEVGSRRGECVVLAIDAKAMHEDGLLFRRSQNGVWLVPFVSCNYIKALTNEQS